MSTTTSSSHNSPTAAKRQIYKTTSFTIILITGPSGCGKSTFAKQLKTSLQNQNGEQEEVEQAEVTTTQDNDGDKEEHSMHCTDKNEPSDKTLHPFPEEMMSGQL